MDIGAHLRENRERLGLALADISAATKLAPHLLSSIERNEFARLPGGIFLKGYLRAYAAAVGVDPEEIVAEYVSQVDAAAAADRPADPPPRPTAKWPSPVPMAAGLAAVILAAVVYVWPRPADRLDVPEVPPQTLTTFATGETTGLPTLAANVPANVPANIPDNIPDNVPDEMPAPMLAPAEDEDQGLHLEIRVTGECWVSAVADGRRLVHRLMQEGERATLVAREALVLQVGDPAMFAYSLNGEPGRRLGRAGVPVTLEITDANYRTFLARTVPEAPARDSSRVL